MSNKNYAMEQPHASSNISQQTYQNNDYYPAQSMNNGYNYPVINQNICENPYSNQMNQRNQYNTNPSYYDHFDTTLWSNDMKLVSEIEKGFKFTDKIETIEISSKDLSPASCCSNIEQLLQPDCLKLTGKDSNYFCNLNYSTSQKFVEYPSCSQIRNDHNVPKYCSIQKQTDFDNKNINYYENQHFEQDPSYFNSYLIPKPLDSNSTCPLPLPTTSDFFLNDDVLSFDAINNLDTRTDDSNGSDIVVEDTDEDDLSETPFCGVTSKCLVCSVAYSTIGSQFYILTKNAPLTMSSQKSVLDKLTELLGTPNLNNGYLYLCSQCLGLINTIDHLQLKLNSCKVELDSKFGKTSEVIVEKPKKSIKNYVFYCKLCRKGITVKLMLQSHLKMHKVQKQFLCELCGQRFSRHRNFYKHKQNHSKSTQKPTFSAFNCRICSKPFRTGSNLKEHENFCSGKSPFKCKLCYKRFTTSTKLKNHIKLKHDKKFNSICSICNIGFIKLSDYKSHMVSHSTDKKYKCPKCEKSYKTLGNLNFHLKFHNKKLPYNCSACAKGFMRKEYLEAHVNIHNNVKNFSCSLCEKKFVSQKNLDAHFKYHDQNSQKKVCNICFKTISIKFEEHLRTHTNLKEFECDECDLRFNTKGALAKHKKRKHREDVESNKEICKNDMEVFQSNSSEFSGSNSGMTFENYDGTK